MATNWIALKRSSSNFCRRKSCLDQNEKTWEEKLFGAWVDVSADGVVLLRLCPMCLLTASRSQSHLLLRHADKLANVQCVQRQNAVDDNDDDEQAIGTFSSDDGSFVLTLLQMHSGHTLLFCEATVQLQWIMSHNELVDGTWQALAEMDADDNCDIIVLFRSRLHQHSLAPLVTSDFHKVCSCRLDWAFVVTALSIDDQHWKRKKEKECCRISESMMLVSASRFFITVPSLGMGDWLSLWQVTWRSHFQCTASR